MREDALAAVRAYRAKPSKARERELQRRCQTLVDHFLLIAKQLFPAGAFVKYIAEYQTGDRGKILHTSQHRQYGRSFLADVKKSDRELGDTKFDSRRYQESLERPFRSTTQVVRSLLLSPKDIIVQERMAIAKSADGRHNREIRVDVVQGVPVNAVGRYDVDYAGVGNVDVDPWFVDPDGLDNLLEEWA